jgi:hypothetical protein
LYRVVNKYMNINHKINDYKSSSFGKLVNMCLLIDNQQGDGRYSAFYKNTNVLVETNELYPYK